MWITYLLLVWSLWMLIGTIFYKYYTNYTWSKAFYMNVNVGWGLNWVLDDSFQGEEVFNQGGMQVFSLIQTVIGYISIGYFCIYIAMQLIVKKNEWLENAHEKQSGTYVSQMLRDRLPVVVQEFDFGMWKFNIIFNLWIVVGILWFSATHHWRVVESFDYVFST